MTAYTSFLTNNWNVLGGASIEGASLSVKQLKGRNETGRDRRFCFQTSGSAPFYLSEVNGFERCRGLSACVPSNLNETGGSALTGGSAPPHLSVRRQGSQVAVSAWRTREARVKARLPWRNRRVIPSSALGEVQRKQAVLLLDQGKAERAGEREREKAETVLR